MVKHKTLVLLKLFAFFTEIRASLIYKNEGDLNIGVLVNDCFQETALKRTLVNTAIWTTDRLNNVKQTSPLTLGLVVFGVCGDDDYYDAVYRVYKERDDHHLLGLVATEELPEKVREFVRVLDVRHKTTPRYIATLIKASVKLLGTLGWAEELTVVAPDQLVLREFYRHTRREWMCVKRFLVYDINVNFDNIEIDLSKPLVVLGQTRDILSFFGHLNFSSSNETNIVLVPFDGAEIKGAPDGTYIIEPPYSDRSQTYGKPQNVLPSPLLFEMADPIISFIHNLSTFIEDRCNDTIYKLNCVRNGFKPPLDHEILDFGAILKILKIEPLSSEFVYNVYRVNNVTAARLETNASDFEYLKTVGLQNYVKTFTFNAVDENLTILDTFDEDDKLNDTDCFKQFERCVLECENFKTFELTRIFSLHKISGVSLRPQPWVFAFISLSVLGAIFCVSILIFILARLCRKNVLEGNPIMTLLLLFVVFVMFCSIIPFSLESDKASRYGIYLARSLGVTLPYTFAFALLLSRTILLATVSREIGFMSHVAGSVQAFLSLFIFAVQLALSLQLTGDCEDVFRGNLLVYLLSYNVILLILLMLITPLITRSQRNYREGKYFTISVMLLGITWSCWLPGYAVLDEEWKDPMLCLGLVSTASILLGTIFIPRTYLMTLSAARERFTSALPSLATATSAMDIYRASTQPVYDCVNVAAINAANTLRTISAPPLPQPDFYSAPDAPDDEDDDFEVTQCDTPPPDKVTRF